MEHPMNVMSNIKTRQLELIDDIVEDHRLRQDMIRARAGIELRAKAMCRRVTHDKIEASKLWDGFQKGAAIDQHLSEGLEPLKLALVPLRATQDAVEDKLLRAVVQLPVYHWTTSVKGFGAMLLASLVGELAAPMTNYSNPAKVWKRMGLAVMTAGVYPVWDQRKGKEGETRPVQVKETGRQRNVAGEESLAHGYNKVRRAVMWNIGSSVLLCQLRGEGNVGHYAEVFAAEKERQLTEKLPADVKARALIAQRRAQRYMEKRILRDMWVEWRRLERMELDERPLETFGFDGVSLRFFRTAGLQTFGDIIDNRDRLLKLKGSGTKVLQRVRDTITHDIGFDLEAV
jgi:hypothetical protein